MKENHHRVLSYSSGYNGKAANPLALQTRHGNDSWNTRELDCSYISDGLSEDTKTMIRVSPTSNHHSAGSRNLNGVIKDTIKLKPDGNDKDLFTPELEGSIFMNDCAVHNKNEPADSVPPVIMSSKTFQEDKHIYTDTGVLNYEPELMVCYKESNSNVKEIRAHEYALCEESGDLHFELPIHDDLVLSGEGSDVPKTKKRLSEEDGNDVSTFARESKSLADLMDSDDQNHAVLLQASEKDADRKIESDIVVEEAIVSRLLSMEIFGTRSSPRSFLKSSNSHEDEKQPPKKVVEHAHMNETHHESVCYYSKSPSIVTEVLSSSLYGSSVTIRQETEPNYKEGYAANTSKALCTGMDVNTVCEFQNSSMEENCENIRQQPIVANNIVDSENPFNESRSIQKSPQQLQPGRWSSNSRANTDVPSAGANKIAGNDSFTILGEACDGEDIIFDVSGQIPYSGPVTDSGSTSMRSESSTTSAKSFAFPVLKPEWTSSPVKMGSVNNRRHFKKQPERLKRGLLCCRF